MNTLSRMLRPSLGVIVAVASLTAAPPAPPGNDADAGTWQMIVLTAPQQFPVAAPSQVGSIDYQAELTSIKNAQARLTPAQRKSIEYWKGGGVVRWNEILRELVARADLPPAPAPDDTYPAPDVNNPFADPGARVRAAQHGDARCRGGVLGDEVLDVFSRGRGSAVLSLPNGVGGQ